MATVAGLVVEISANAKKFHRTVDGIKSRAQKFATQLKSILSAATKTVVAGATAAAAAVTATITQTSLAMRDLVRDAEAVGATARDLQSWQYAARDVGLEADKVGDIFKDTQDKIGDFVRTGGGEAADLFEQMGLNARDFIGLAPDQALLRIGAALDGLSQGEKIFFMESIADDASRLIPLLDNNAERFKALTEQGREWGLIMTDAEIKASAALGSTLTKAGRMATGFKNLLGANLAPTFSALIGWIEDLADGFGGPRQAAEAMARGIVQAMRDAVSGIQVMMQKLEDAYYWYVRIRELELNAQAALEAGQNALTPGQQATPAMDALKDVRQTRSDLEAGNGFGSDTVGALDQLLKRMDEASTSTDGMGESAKGAAGAFDGAARTLKTTSDSLQGILPTNSQSAVPERAGSPSSGLSLSSITPMSQAEARAMQAARPAANGATAQAAAGSMASGQAVNGRNLGTLTLKNDKGEAQDFFTENADAASKWLADTLSGAASAV